MASDFKFGAKLKLFGEHDIIIEPNPDHPNIVEYHDDNGIPVTRDFVSEKLNIKNETIKNMIPEQTRVTDFVLNRKSKSVELGVVIEPGEDFVLNRYKDIFVIDEVSLFYTYDPNAGHNLEVEVDGNIDVDAIKEKVVDTAIDAIAENNDNEEPDPIVDEMDEEPDPIVEDEDMEEPDPIVEDEDMEEPDPIVDEMDEEPDPIVEDEELPEE